MLGAVAYVRVTSFQHYFIAPKRPTLGGKLPFAFAAASNRD